jgi:hypothetical protein
MKKFTLMVAMGLLLSVLAHASIIAVLNSGPTPVAGGFAFNYGASLSGDERLDL